MEPAYLDYNATAPIRPEAAQAVAPYLRDGFANPNSPYRIGQEVRRAVESARESVARLLGAKSSREIVFTSSGSEANSAALYGAAWHSLQQSGRKKIIVSSIEHDSVREMLPVLSSQGFRIYEAQVRSDGLIDCDSLFDAIDEETALVSVMQANNETGTIEPIEKIAAYCREKGVLFHSDAVQSAGKIEITASTWGADLLSVSGHKLGALKGAGALYIRDGVKLFPLIAGLQEKRRRGGTENVVGIVSFGEAAKLALAELPNSVQYSVWQKQIEKACLSVEGVFLNGGGAKRLPNTSNFSIEGLDGHSLSIALDLEGVLVSSGSACQSGLSSPSHVLKAMGLPKNLIKGALRVSTGWRTKQEEVDRFIQLFPDVVKKMRSVRLVAA